jgi:hypothetical protein
VDSSIKCVLLALAFSGVDRTKYNFSVVFPTRSCNVITFLKLKMAGVIRSSFGLLTVLKDWFINAQLSVLYCWSYNQ